MPRHSRRFDIRKLDDLPTFFIDKESGDWLSTGRFGSEHFKEWKLPPPIDEMNVSLVDVARLVIMMRKERGPESYESEIRSVLRLLGEIPIVHANVAQSVIDFNKEYLNRYVCLNQFARAAGINVGTDYLVGLIKDHAAILKEKKIRDDFNKNISPQSRPDVGRHPKADAFYWRDYESDFGTNGMIHHDVVISFHAGLERLAAKRKKKKITSGIINSTGVLIKKGR